tara:strand:- start:1272 stop:3014 length:1743 start_codon:yes stop_codon:yes gene_type:complete
MAVSSPPILKILSDLDIDLMDINNDVDYLRALMEATNALTITNASDKRIPILQDEIQRVRADRKAADPKFKQRVKKTKVDPAKITGRKMLTPGKGMDEQKLLPTEDSKKITSQGDTNVLADILVSITSIRDLLINQIKQKRTDSKKKRRAAENAKRDKKESGLEMVKKGFGALKSGVSKVIEPVKSLFGQVFGFIGKIILGRVLFKLIEWFQDKKNQKKVAAIGKFLKKTWPVLLSAFLLFGTSFGRMAVKLGVMITKFSIRLVTKIIPALIKAIAKMKIGSLLKKIPGFSGGGLVKGYNEGGIVDGQKGVDKVPAMLTEGEFVMSKGAVEQYGTDTLEGMNAAAGGTNRPTLMGGFANITNTETTSSTDSDGNFSFGMTYVSPEEAKERIAEMGMPSMVLMDGTVIPDFGKMSGEKVTQGLQLTRDIMVENEASPERIAQLDQVMAMPDAQPDSIATMVNQLVPGSMENTMMNVGADISASAKMKGGGLVQGFQGGGQVRQMGRGASKKRMEIKKGINKPNVKSIKTPVKKSSVVAYNEQAQAAGGGYQSKSGGNNDVPNFNAAAKRSLAKIKTLGISV